MEDGMEEIQNLVLAESKSLEGGEVEEPEQTKERGEAKASELVKNFIVNLVPVNGGEEGKPDDEKSCGLTEDVRKEENQKEGGIINHLISNLVSPRMSPTTKKADEDERKGGAGLEVKSEDHGTFKSKEEFEGGGGGCGGIINNLISNMFHHDHGGLGEGREEKEEKAEAGGGRGGLVDELISNLPTPLAEDAAPATDEASILIHSIVHD